MLLILNWENVVQGTPSIFVGAVMAERISMGEWHHVSTGGSVCTPAAFGTLEAVGVNGSITGHLFAGRWPGGGNLLEPCDEPEGAEPSLTVVPPFVVALPFAVLVVLVLPFLRAPFDLLLLSTLLKVT